MKRTTERKMPTKCMNRKKLLHIILNKLSNNLVISSDCGWLWMTVDAMAVQCILCCCVYTNRYCLQIWPIQNKTREIGKMAIHSMSPKIDHATHRELCTSFISTCRRLANLFCGTNGPCPERKQSNKRAMLKCMWLCDFSLAQIEVSVQCTQQTAANLGATLMSLNSEHTLISLLIEFCC